MGFFTIYGALHGWGAAVADVAAGTIISEFRSRTAVQNFRSRTIVAVKTK